MADDMFDAPKPADVALQDIVGCVDRELKMRAKVYPRWVKDGKLTKEAAAREMLLMRAVRERVLQTQAMALAVAACLVGAESATLRLRAEEYLADLRTRYPEPIDADR